MGRQRHRPRREEDLPVPGWWKAQLREWLGPVRSGRRKELSEAIDCHPAAISKLLAERTKRSGLVGPICDHTGLKRPIIDAHDHRSHEWQEQLPGLSEADYEHILHVIRRLRGVE